jgi:hypothetical protein
MMVSVWRGTVAVTAGIAIALATAGTAAASSPAWKLYAVTGPTNLPPRQSEVQRLAVEAEGGSFTLAQRTAVGEGTLGFADGFAEAKSGSNLVAVTFPLAGTFAVGQSVSGVGIPGGTTVVGLSGTPAEPVLELSDDATITEEIFIEAASKEVRGVTTSSGGFHVGDEISGEGIPSDTSIVAASAGTLTLSNLVTGGGTVSLSGEERTTSIAYNATAESLQTALESLPALGSGAVSVSGGPGGEVTTPYFLTFRGALADTNVAELSGDRSALLGVHSNVHVFTVVPGGAGTGELAISLVNVGGAPSIGTVTVQIGPLPPGIVLAGPPSAIEAEGEWTCAGEAGKPVAAGETVATCTSHSLVRADQPDTVLNLPLEVDSADAQTLSTRVTVSGGGVTTPVSYEAPITISLQPAAPGIQVFWAGAYDADGNPSTQAGGHPFAALTAFSVNTVRSRSGGIIPAADTRNVNVDLPPGFTANPLVMPRCPQSTITFGNLPGEPPACTAATYAGTLIPFVSGFNAGAGFGAETGAIPFVDDVPAPGTAAEFTTMIGPAMQSVVGSVRAEEDFGVRASAPNIPPVLKFYGSVAAFNGEPAGAQGRAFLVNPTDCAQQREELEQGRGPATRIEADTWQQPSVFDKAEDPLPLLTGCQALTSAWLGQGPEPSNERPSFTFQPTTTRAASPAGATARLHIPQAGLSNMKKLATADLKKAIVTLPQGLALNPSSANGLEACSEAQIGYLGSGFPSPNPVRFNELAPSCPDGSKLGTFEISTPLLEEKLEGTIYLAAQEENPFGSLIALYLVVESPRFGITLKLGGEVRPDPTTGQLTATFDNNPQLPFEDLTLHFRGGGGRSELATPEVCGHYQTTGSLTPWSAESGEAAQIEEQGFTVSSGCAASPASRPFAPSFEAGTSNPVAGAYSPLVIKVNRDDGEQELTKLNFTLPEGLIGNLASAPYCSDAAIEAARAKSGRSEQASPSCPAASQIGSVDAAAGVGSEPIHVGGHAYMAGPYEGAPLSAVVITPAVAGPFDLGDVVVRAPLFVNSTTAQITAKSDALPTILKGIPLKLRSVAITLDRSNFTLNPTSCAAMTVTASIGSSNGATANPSNRFQVGGCTGLPFKPTLSATTQGKASKANGASLVVKIAAKPGEANIGKVNLQLPLQLPSRLTTLQKACTEAQFNINPAACPADSVIGSATAHTPILQVPLSGPAYLVSHGNAAFPDVEFMLQANERGGNIEIVLDGGTQIKKGITYSNFETVPDAPISSFETVLPTGPHSILTTNLPASDNYNLCGQALKMPTTLTGQNGAVLKQSTPIAVTGCPPSIKVMKHTVKGKTATFVVSVPSAGKLTAKGAGLTSAAKTVSAAKSITLKVKLNKKEQAFLARHPHRKLKLHVKLQFTPKKGARLSTSVAVLIG